MPRGEGASLVGGSDDPTNLVALCPFHHLRCVHGGFLRVFGRAPDDLTWFLGGNAVEGAGRAGGRALVIVAPAHRAPRAAAPAGPLDIPRADRAWYRSFKETTVTFQPLRAVPPPAGYGRGDVLVLFGELFGRGYANGIVEAARARGMTVIGATVGRRDPDGTLRPLTPDELATAEAGLGGRIVNVPLEAGFDLEPAGAGGPSPVDLLRGVKADAWDGFTLDRAAIEAARAAGADRFERHLTAFAAALEPLVPKGANVLVVHTMAGGFPRARNLMPLITRVFRGVGEKYVPSEAFWASDLGWLWAASFEEVTARTFQRLVAATGALRQGRRVAYVAYGYHGTEVLVGGRPTWQSYVPYLQGWAKLALERFAEEAWRDGVRCTVFDAPEIWTNSSALFLGVEVSLYPLLEALRRADPASPVTAGIWARCRERLRHDATLEGLLARADAYLTSPEVAPLRELARWPQHSTRAQLEVMLAASDAISAMSQDPRDPVAAELSRAVFDAVGRLMLDASWEPPGPVRWVGHDVVAARLLAPA